MRRCQLSLLREEGSAVIEALVIGSVTFLIVIATASAAIRITVAGSEIQEAARAGAVHAARHDHPEAARTLVSTLFPGVDVSARRSADRFEVAASTLMAVPHPFGPARVVVNGRAAMPLAPFRSDRG